MNRSFYYNDLAAARSIIGSARPSNASRYKYYTNKLIPLAKAVLLNKALDRLVVLTRAFSLVLAYWAVLSASACHSAKSLF